MKNKTKTTKKTTKVILGISRTAQKTFVIAVIFAYIVMSYMIVHDTIKILNSTYTFDASPFLVYAIPAVAVPLIAFIVLLALSNKKSTKLWRVFHSVLLTVFLVLVYGMLMAANNVIFQGSLGYTTNGVSPSALLLQLIPPVLTVIIAAIVGLLLRASEKTANAISPRLQWVFIITLPLFALIQIGIMFTGFTSGGMTDPLDSSSVAGLFMGLAIPAVIIAVLYLVVSKKQPRLLRLLVAIIYAIIGAFVFFALVSLSYQISNNLGNSSSVVSPLDVPEWVSLAVFIGIVIWHKMKKVM